MRGSCWPNSDQELEMACGMMSKGSVYVQVTHIRAAKPNILVVGLTRRSMAH